MALIDESNQVKSPSCDNNSQSNNLNGEISTENVNYNSVPVDCEPEAAGNIDIQSPISTNENLNSVPQQSINYQHLPYHNYSFQAIAPTQLNNYVQTQSPNLNSLQLPQANINLASTVPPNFNNSVQLIQTSNINCMAAIPTNYTQPPIECANFYPGPQNFNQLAVIPHNFNSYRLQPVNFNPVTVESAHYNSGPASQQNFNITRPLLRENISYVQVDSPHLNRFSGHMNVINRNDESVNINDNLVEPNSNGGLIPPIMNGVSIPAPFKSPNWNCKLGPTKLNPRAIPFQMSYGSDPPDNTQTGYMGVQYSAAVPANDIYQSVPHYCNHESIPTDEIEMTLSDGLATFTVIENGGFNQANVNYEPSTTHLSNGQIVSNEYVHYENSNYEEYYSNNDTNSEQINSNEQFVSSLDSYHTSHLPWFLLKEYGKEIYHIVNIEDIPNSDVALSREIIKFYKHHSTLYGTMIAAGTRTHLLEQQINRLIKHESLKLKSISQWFLLKYFNDSKNLVFSITNVNQISFINENTGNNIKNNIYEVYFKEGEKQHLAKVLYSASHENTIVNQFLAFKEKISDTLKIKMMKKIKQNDANIIRRNNWLLVKYSNSFNNIVYASFTDYDTVWQNTKVNYCEYYENDGTMHHASILKISPYYCEIFEEMQDIVKISESNIFPIYFTTEDNAYYN